MKFRRTITWKPISTPNMEAAGIRDGGKSPRFHSAAGRTGTLTDKPMNRINAWR